MPKMRKGKIVLDVVEHIIIQNGWEYYLNNEKDGSRRFGVVYGDEIEMGYCDTDEMRPYITSRTTRQSEIAELQPAPGWQWI